MDATNLEGMKRAELQKLAKKAGIKANKKTDHLISELKKYYANNTTDTDKETCEDSHTDSFTTATSEHETTTTESETEAKPKVTRGRRGRKATKKSKKASRSDQDTDASEIDETIPVEEEKLIKDSKADTQPKRVTKPKRGRRGRKRAATPSPVKDVTPAKITKQASESEVPVSSSVKKTPQSEKLAVAATRGSSTKRAATKVSKTPTSEEKTETSVKTPINETVTVAATRGSSSRRAAKKTVVTPVVKSSTPSVTKTATPVIAETKTTKRSSTRGSSSKKTTSKKRRRSTFEVIPATKTQTPQATSSPAKKTTIKSCPKMKAEIMADIEKKAAEEQAKQTTRIPIPRFGQAAKKPSTPGNKNWAKIHATSMSKVESIDDYLERKRKRTETMCASVKRAKIVAEEAKAAIETLKAHRTPKGDKIAKPVVKPKVNFMSPHPASKSVNKAVKPKAIPSFASPAFKRATKPKTPTVPTTASKSVSFKVSKLKTPKPALALAGGKTACQKRISTPGMNSASRKSIRDAASEKRKSLMASGRKSLLASGRKSIGDAASQRKSVGGGTTPFKFGENKPTTTPGAKKTTFDLKASLGKGLTYKPHTGKLKPLNEVNFHFSASKPTHQSSVSKPKIQHNNIAKAKAELKKPKVATRQDRRAGANKRRTGKRADNLMSRRGIQFDN